MRALPVTTLVTLLAIACGTDSTSTSSASSSSGSSGGASSSSGGGAPVETVACPGITPDATVTVVNYVFTPAQTTLSAGQVLRFVPAGPHDMTSGTNATPDGVFATPTSMDACLRFNTVGTHPYYCSVHTSMTGSVLVQ